MQKKSWFKILLCIVFVLAAGVFYLCMEGQETGEVQKQEGQEGQEAEGTQQAGDAGGLDDAKNPGKADSALDGDGTPEEDFALLYVHVCGSVQHPGVYRLPENSRIVEAIEAAGGFREEAAADYLNQAGLLQDGQKVYVPSLQEAEELKAGNKGFWDSGSGAGENASAGSALVNINTATASQLTELPGIGQSKAEAIIAYREQHGSFKACEDLMEVPGIKEAAYQKIYDKITTGN